MGVMVDRRNYPGLMSVMELSPCYGYCVGVVGIS